MTDEKKITISMNLFVKLTLILLFLKLLGFITISWFWVFSPITIPLFVFFVLPIVLFGIVALFAFIFA